MDKFIDKKATHKKIYFLNKKGWRDGPTAEYSLLSLGVFSSQYPRWMAHNSSARGSDALSWPPQAPAHVAYSIYSDTYT